MRPAQPAALRQRFTPAPLAMAAAMAIALAAGHAPLVHAQSGAAAAAATPIAFNIRAQPLGQALNELARQADLQMTFPAALVAGKQAPALAGPLTLRQALDRLLAGSGLGATVADNKVLVTRAAPPAAAQTAPTSPVLAEAPTMPTITVTATAEEALRQAPGVSLIPAQEIAKQPPANDLSQIVRTMPGVNLTGNSPSGQFGNSRQIDLRGMGPENTLILIDGVPVRARNSTRMGRSGERNTRGDSNWVPVEAVERIEVLRGPAAARYGSGSAGGVVNIITRQATDTFSGALSLYTNQPQSDDEQATQRFGFLLAGPLGQQLSFRVYGNANKTEADRLDLNAPFASSPTPPAGREGVRNRDANLQLRWAPDAAQSLALNLGFSRQGNIYAGDRALNAGFAGLNSLAEAGAETNTLIRRTTSLIHRKDWGQRRSSRLTLSLEDTDNTRLREGLTGGSEGLFLRDPANTQQAAGLKSTSVLRNTLLSGEFNTPWAIAGLDQLVTIGFEASQERLDDPYAVSNANPAIGVTAGRPTRAETETVSVFAESNIAATDDLLLTPGVRLDHNDRFGANWSPSLNLAWQLTPAVSLKAGIARAFKVPNLYQSNPNYLWETNGNGCPVNWPRPNNSGCSILGNPDLKPETSLNQEIGLAYDANGLQAGLTYFHNNYKDKVVADMPDQTPVLLPNGRYLFFWTNASAARVRGLEGHLTLPLGDGNDLRWRNNLTLMLENRNRSTGQPLATVPRYTLNSTLEWQATERLDAVVTATFYGRQQPPTRAINGSPTTGAATQARSPYGLLGVNLGYRWDSGLTLRAGISNLLDKRLFREHNQAGAGANTYNEAGRAFYLSVRKSF